jgi:hypothetical protein
MGAARSPSSISERSATCDIPSRTTGEIREFMDFARQVAWRVADSPALLPAGDLARGHVSRGAPDLRDKGLLHLPTTP